MRPPRRSDEREWLSLRAESRSFLEPWEPAWPHDALTPRAYRRRLERIRQEWSSGTGYAFFLYENASRRLIGGITLANVRYGVVQSTSIGYWTGRPYARRGYMHEGLQLTLDYCFRKLQLHRVEAACLTNNLPSRNLLLKAGFHPEGRARKYLCIAGRWQDHDTFAILRTDPRPSVPIRET